MKYKMSNLWAINFLGYLFLGAGVAGTVADFVRRYLFSFPLDLGIVLGNCALIAVGLLATMEAKSLKDLDRRLQGIEEIQRRPQP